MNILHTHIIQLIVFITVSTSSTVSAQVEAYLPFTQAELSNRFPLPKHIIHMTGAQSLSTIQISMTPVDTAA